MRPEHRAPRPAWGENPQRTARYDAVGRKPRAVRTSGGGPVVEDGKIPIYTQRAAALVTTLGHYRWSLLGISAWHPHTRGNPIPGRWINGGSRRAGVHAVPGAVPLAEFGPVDPVHGFPEYYQDSNGLALQVCLDFVCNP